MEYCTNCGAAAREGAKFCTSCGIRLESGVTAVERPPDDTQETSTLDTASPEPAEAAEPSSDDAPPSTAESEGIAYEESWPDPDEAPDTASEELPAAAGDTGVSGWPAPEATAPDEATAPPTTEAEESVTGWGSAGAGAVEHQAHPDDDVGPSEWEGWSPTPSPESTVHEHHEDFELREIQDLAAMLQQRLTRLTDPAPVAARGVDADELADRLDGWASEGPASNDLLQVIREVRANPRDIDAVTRLADRAGDLEQLMERYSAIRADAQRWVARLRTHDGSADA